MYIKSYSILFIFFVNFQCKTDGDCAKSQCCVSNDRWMIASKRRVIGKSQSEISSYLMVESFGFLSNLKNGKDNSIEVYGIFKFLVLY